MCSLPTPSEPERPYFEALAATSPAALMWRLMGGLYDPTPAHVQFLSERLALAAMGETPRLLVTEPPRHGKSELVSHAFPVWYLNAFPNRRVILASYEADFAASWGRKVRNTIERGGDLLGVRIAADSSAANRWETTSGGGMVTAGVGGPITGRGADLLIIDDPVKNSEEAESEVFRERAWDWWTSTAYTRLEPNGIVVLLQTRWHEDDLAGRILSRANEHWESVNLPALAELDDPLGRAEGEALWPARYPVAALERIRAEVGSRVWSALYGQRPMPAEGGLFKKEWLDGSRYQISDDGLYLLYEGKQATLANLRRFATVDLATSTKTSADYTVICVFGIGADGTCFLLHVDRARREGPDIIPAIRKVMAERRVPAVWIEAQGFQLSIVQQARREGIAVRELAADRDKVSRALPLTAAFEAKRIRLPLYAAWLGALESELLSFPMGTHDDQVDAMSYGVGVIPQVRGGTAIVAGPSAPVAHASSGQGRYGADFVPARPW